MPITTIPNSVRPGLKVLLSLTPEQASSLVHSLKTLPLDLTMDDLVTTLSATLAPIKQADHRKLITAVFSLYTLQSRRETQSEQTASDVVDAATKLAEFRPLVSGDVRQSAIDVMTKVLNIDEVQQRIKMLDVTNQYERRFHDIRILSDIRPVYGDNPAEPPSQLHVMHTIKLSFHDETSIKDIYVSVHPQDLPKLTEAIERAEAKQRSLQILISRFNLMPKGGEAQQ